MGCDGVLPVLSKPVVVIEKPISMASERSCHMGKDSEDWKKANFPPVFKKLDLGNP